MARKKQEIALQIEINTQEEWDELMKKEGLMVVDVYQDWCGPCKAVTGFFRRIKNEIGDDFLNFAVAKADTIDSLDKYRGKCEPCFLIYGGRSLVAVIRGANPPVLEETIKSKLEEEHRVMKGEMERNEIRDPLLAEVDVEEKVQEVEKVVQEIEREVTLALIKPDIVKAGKVDEIIEKLEQYGIEILAQEERNLSTDEASEFYSHLKDSEHFDDLIKFITSGPSFVLVLAKGDEGIIHEFRELIGPKVVDEAKETAPTSIRAMYGTTSIENAIHGADDSETVQRELAFFFPDFVVPKISRKIHEDINVQRTLALIRPVAYTHFKESILEKITNAGFKISMQKEVQLTKEDAALFYAVHKDKPFFNELITEMSRGTLLALALEKQNAVQGWRGLLGPKDVEKAKEIDPSSLRAQFSREDLKINLIHGSHSDERAQEELKYFFPIEQTIAAIKPDGIENEEEIVTAIVNAKFKIAKTKTITMEKGFAEEFYADVRDQDYFDDLIAHMESGPTIFMILSREDAIRGWRSMMGPKDPKTADETYPDSIRAIYGRDVTKNAVYGSENQAEVDRIMNLVFGHLGFDKDGCLLPEFTEKSESVEVTKDEIVVTEDSHEETVVVESTDGDSKRFFGSSERILMEPEVSDQHQDAQTIADEKPEELGKVDLEPTTEHPEINQEISETSEEKTKPSEEEAVKVTETSQEQEIVTNTEDEQNKSQQETILEESKETTVVEEQSIVEYSEDITVVEESIQESENIDVTGSSKIETSVREDQSNDDKTVFESSEVEKPETLIEPTVTEEQSTQQKTDESSVIKGEEESVVSVEEKTETELKISEKTEQLVEEDSDVDAMDTRDKDPTLSDENTHTAQPADS